MAEEAKKLKVEMDTYQSPSTNRQPFVNGNSHIGNVNDLFERIDASSAADSPSRRSPMEQDVRDDDEAGSTGFVQRRLTDVAQRGTSFLSETGGMIYSMMDSALYTNRRRFSTYEGIAERVRSESGTGEQSQSPDDDDATEDRNYTPLSGVFRKLCQSRPVRWFMHTGVGRWFNKNIIGEVEGGHQYNRIIDRGGFFFQSLGKMAIKKRIRSEDWHALYAGDLFHSLVDAPTPRILLILLSTYFFLVTSFSIAYYLISKMFGCDMGIDTYQEAFAFSLETMATIGYGTQDIFFNNCWAPVFTLGLQISCKLISEAVIIGVIYCRFTRPSKRASTIIFTNKAIIRRIAGKLYFMFQLVELRKHQLVTAHVRLYVIRRDIAPPDEEDETQAQTQAQGIQGTSFQGGGSTGFPQGVVTHFQTCKMRLSFPNDELGGLLIMCLPQVIVHELDAWSPLMPPHSWRSCVDGKVYNWTPPAYDCVKDDRDRDRDRDRDQDMMDEEGSEATQGRTMRALSRAVTFPNIPGRSDGPLSGVSEVSEVILDEEEEEEGEGLAIGMVSPAGLRYGNNSRSSSNSNISSSSVNSKSRFSPSPKRPTVNPLEAKALQFEAEKEMIQRYMIDRKMEIFAIVEGTDATTGGPCQARHSFLCSEIEWDKSFAPCVFEDARDGSAVIDFSVFHDLIDVAQNATYCGSIPSHT